MTKFVEVAIVSSIIVGADFPTAGQMASAKIVVGPDILVSRDGNFPHVELMLAANPRNPKNFVGGAITATRREGGTATTVYASTDGGYTWTPTPFAEQLITGGGDPQAAFSASGTALFTTLAHVSDETGRTRAALHVYRSRDGGLTWDKPTDLGYSYDHEMIVVDHSVGKLAGRIYIGTLWGYPTYRIGVFRSDDDGRTFTGPVEATNGRGELGINVANMLILSDGTLFMPYVDFEFKPERRKDARSSGIWFVTSPDGAITFSTPRKIGTQTRVQDPPRERYQGFPMFAVDNRSEKFRDRLYAAWNDLRSGHPQILFTYSRDRGNSWTEPRLLGNADSQAADQFQPSLAVNADGTLAITWYDTRGFPNHDHFHEYFAASIDGGESFLPEVPVSSVASTLAGDGNLALTPSDFRSADSWRINLLSAASRWGNGGDYMGLCADAHGVFHPFWADARTGTFQIWTASVRVDRLRAKGETGDANGGIGTAPQQSSRTALKPERVSVPLRTQVELVYDPTLYDRSSEMLEMPVRLKNVSTAPIYPPIAVTIVKFGSGQGDDDKENAPQLLNAVNGKAGDGAVFDYSNALGNLDALEPGALTGAIVWEMKLINPMRSPNIHINVTGTIEK
jgi:hypothetical protein